MAETKYIDYLDEDEPINGQNFVCMSFLSPEKIRNTSLRGIKIRGVFRTREEADEHCKKLQISDPDFDVFVGEMGKWLPWNPDPNDAQDQVYQEKELQKLMEGHKDNLSKVKRLEQQRKNDMIKDGKQEHQKLQKQQQDNNHDPEKTRERLRKKLEEKNAKLNLTPELASKDLALKEKEELAKAERERLNSVEQVVSEKAQNIESIDDKLAKIQQLYNKLNKK
jgi:hypothetical protein